MILPDINFLVHAHNENSLCHAAARQWWDGALSETERLALPWAVLLGFIRLTTNRHVLHNPCPVEEALHRMQQWLAQPNVRIIQPTHRHAEILARFLRGLGTAGNMTTDAHLAALAVEHGCTLYTTDSDFARFPGLSWKNPLI